MEKVATASRIHPLFAAAAVSVIALSGTGIAAMTGLLPSSKAEPAAYVVPQTQPAQPAVAAGAQQLAAGQMTGQLQGQLPGQLSAQQLPAQPLQQQAYMPEAVPAPVVRQPVVQASPERVAARDSEYREPAPRKHVHREPARSYAERHPQPAPAPAPAAQPSQPNYVAIGTGAVVGGLLGNQVGDGNGKKLATLAGIIGGGYIGNEIANRNK